MSTEDRLIVEDLGKHYFIPSKGAPEPPKTVNLGFRRVVTPPGMVAPYYERIGFRGAGDAYVLDLA